MKAGGEEMSDEDFENLIQRSCDLPTLPSVASKVVALVSEPGTTAEELNKAIMTDQSLAARVLKLANSSFYGCLRSVSTLTQAIMIIGFNTIKNIVLAASMKETYKRFGLTEKMLYEHSVGVAIASQIIARECKIKNVEEAFLVGLFHDIGKVIINNNMPDQYQKVMEKVYNKNCSFSKAEQELLGFTHSMVGALVVKKWKLSSEVENVIRYHNMISRLNNDDPYLLQLTAVVNLADATCYKIGIGTKKPLSIDLARFKSAGILGLDVERLSFIEAEVKKTCEKEGELMNV